MPRPKKQPEYESADQLPPCAKSILLQLLRYVGEEETEVTVDLLPTPSRAASTHYNAVVHYLQQQKANCPDAANAWAVWAQNKITFKVN